MSNPALEKIERERRFAQIVMNVFADHNIAVVVDPNTLHFKCPFVQEFSSNGGQVSAAIIDHMFPKESEEIFFHYTSANSFENILKEKQLRLYSLDKWFNSTAGEIVTFARKYGLDGIFETTDGKQYLRTVAEDLFYLSLTDPSATNELVMWDWFAQNGTGARLRLRVRLREEHMHRSELRKTRYEGDPSNLLDAINQSLLSEKFKPFMPWTISRAAAFFLRDEVAIESEKRLLYKHFPSNPDLRVSDGKYDYWPLPLQQANGVADVGLVSVSFGPSADEKALQSILDISSFAGIDVEP